MLPTSLSSALPLSVVLAAFAAGSVHRLDAQKPIPDSRSAITGVVVDPSHAAMPGVTIVLEDLARRRSHRATTDRQGRFDLRDLPAGDYEAEVTVPGFAVFREPVLLAGPLIEREVVLGVATLEETVTVVVAGDQGAEAGERREPGAAEPCVPRVDEQTQSPVGGQLRPARMLTRATPLFPEHLRSDEREGIVQLAGRIGADGSVADVTVVEASHPDYATAAEDAVRGWTWEAPLLNCTPIEMDVSVTVRFLPQRP